MSYIRLEDFPEPVRLFIQKLSWLEQSRLLRPTGDPARARPIQGTIIRVLEESIRDNESEESMLSRLRAYAKTEWA